MQINSQRYLTQRNHQANSNNSPAFGCVHCAETKELLRPYKVKPEKITNFVDSAMALIQRLAELGGKDLSDAKDTEALHRQLAMRMRDNSRLKPHYMVRLVNTNPFARPEQDTSFKKVILVHLSIAFDKVKDALRRSYKERYVS